MRSDPHHPERGSVLLLSYLMAASTLLVLIQVFAARSFSESRLTQRFLTNQQAPHTAEAGLDDAYANLANDPAYAGTDSNWNGTDAGDWQDISPRQTVADPSIMHQQFRTRIENSTALPAGTPSNRYWITAQGRTTWDATTTRTLRPMSI